MKILHTSDWHLGHTLYNFDRTEEQIVMLLQMVNIVKQEKPDVFLLCGDVYHTPQPSAAVQTMFTNALVEIHKANPEMAIIITAGNHDSGTKHDIFRTPWKALKVYTIGSIDANQKEDMIIEVPEKGYVIAIPYVNERNMPKGLFQDLLDIVEARNVDNLPVVMTAHTTVRGCDFVGHKNASEYAVGGIDSYNLDDMGTGYDYLALGHIHHGQFIHSGKHNVRYCGTPIPISFDENYKHSVSIVEITEHREKPIVQEIEINPHRPLVTLPIEGVATWEDAKELLANYPNDIEAYIRLNVEVDDFLPVEANAEALMICEDKKCRFCVINSQRLKKNHREAKVMSVQEFKTEEPIEIAERYAEDLGIEFDNDMKELFNETLSALKDEERM
ncbi:exonuclease subunit SbcD [Prevotella sp. HUN102]|uniref:metallophosphoesterase family protein n=1 Tax=Prevotella sp. HUN102 TaxID=1392486 RepID=UPI00048CEE5D|nr:exonuclease subunit SbcD [Prevotella sp. HUN102]